MPDALLRAALPPVQRTRHARPAPVRASSLVFVDTKTLYARGKHYLQGARALEDQAGAVAARALEVNGEYRRHARDLDAEHSPAGTTPISDRLRSYGEVRAAAFGNYGEGSADVHAILEAAASAAARARWRPSGARSAAELFGILIAHYRRRMGMRAVQAMATCRLERVPFIGLARPIVAAIVRRREPVPLPAGMNMQAAADLMHAVQLAHGGLPGGRGGE